MSELVGHVDERHRPLVALYVPDRDERFLAVVDTGFNGHLLMQTEDAKRLGFQVTDVTVAVELADHARGEFTVARGEIEWLGLPTRIEVWVSEETESRTRSPDAPIALLGTTLLNPNRLTVDFEKRRVTIAAVTGE